MIEMNCKLNNFSFMLFSFIKTSTTNNSKVVDLVGSTKAYIMYYGLLNNNDASDSKFRWYVINFLIDELYLSVL